MDDLEEDKKDEIGSILMKLLKDNPDAPLLCLHRALEGSSHVCPQSDSPPKIVPVFCTPLQLRKVVSPQNLELDSDTSSVGGWSLSMATPHPLSTTKGKPLPVSSLLSTTCESTTTDEGFSVVSDESVCRRSYKKEKKKGTRVLLKGHEPVIRTLFPRPLSSSIESPQLPSLQSDTPTHVITSPGHVTPSPPADTTAATASLFETPHKQPVKKEVGNEGGTCSQELFGSPNVFSPDLPITVCRSADERTDGMRRFDWGKNLRSPDGTLSDTPGGAPQTRPLIHSTPLNPLPTYSGASSSSILQPEAAKTPNTIQCKPGVPLMEGQRVVTTPTLGKEDVFDMLFMSKSQLESKLSTRSERTEECRDDRGTSEREGKAPEHYAIETGGVQPEHSCDDKGPSTPKLRLASKQSLTPEMEAPVPKRKKLTTKAMFLYPSNQSSLRKRMRVRETTISRAPEVSSTPPPKKVCDGASPKKNSCLNIESFKIPSTVTTSTEKDDFARKSSEEPAQIQEAPTKHIDEILSPPSVRVCVDSAMKADDEKTRVRIDALVSDKETLNDSHKESDAVSIDESVLVEQKTQVEDVCTIVESQETKATAAQDEHEELGNNGDHATESTLMKLSHVPKCETVYNLEESAADLVSNKVPASAVTETLAGSTPQPPAQPTVSGLRRSFGKSSHKKALEHTNVMQAIEEESVPLRVEPANSLTLPNSDFAPFIGFKMASGAAVSLSEAALEKAKQLIGEDIQYESSPALNKASTLSKTPSSSSSSTPKLIVPEKNLSALTTPSLTEPLVSSSFSTKQTPSTIKSTNVQRPKPKQFKAPRLASSVSKAEEKASVAKILRKFGVKPDSTPSIEARQPQGRMMETGFSTASGSKLSTSHSAMTKARRLLVSDKENGMGSGVLESTFRAKNSCAETRAEFDSSKNSMERSNDAKELTGFKTASGKGLSVSIESLEKAQKLASEDQEQSSGAGDHLPSAGFQTASGKGITVSSEALARARAIISETESSLPARDKLDTLSPHMQTATTGFKTAAGSAVTVTRESLHKAKQMLGEELSTEPQTPKGGRERDDHHVVGPSVSNSVSVEGGDQRERFMTGFSTAGGRAISVSSESMKKAEEDVPKDDDVIAMDPFTPEQGCPENDYTSCLSAKQVESLHCFTQAAPKPAPPPEIPSARNEKNTLQADELPLSDATSVREDKDESTSCYFSTQDVRQLLDFSSDEGSFTGVEMSADPTRKEEVCSPSSNGSSSGSLAPETPDAGDRLLKLSDLDTPSKEDRGGKKCNLFDPVSPGTNLIVGIRLCDLEATFSSEYLNRLDTSNLSVVKEVFSKSMIESMETSLVADPQSKASDESLQGEEGRTIKPEAPSVDDCEVSDKSDFSSLPTSGEESPYEDRGNTPEPLQRNERIEEHSKSANHTVIGAVNAKDLIKHEEIKSHSPAVSVVESPEIKTQDHSESAVSIPDTPPHSSGIVQPATSRGHFSAGFMTAGGRKVDISEEALAAVRRKFSEQDTEPIDRHSLPGLQTASGKKVKISEESLSAVKSKLPSFPGLQTASGKKVEVSEQALQAARATLDDTVIKTSQVHHSFGLHTASGKEVSVSEESILAAKATLDSSTFPGLQTAGGKKVSVSEKAIQAARATLDSSKSLSFAGLQTASGKRVSVSEDSFRAAKAKLDSSSTSRTFPGLQTASGNEVSISEESILAAKATLDSSTFPGLQTASGHKVDISKKHLQAARASLADNLPCSSSNSPASSQEERRVLDDGKTSLVVGDTSMSGFQPPLKSVRTVGQSSALLETTPTAKYKPVFKSGGSKKEDGATRSSEHDAFGQPQRRLGTLKRGLISTPEGSLRDRRPHRPLLSTQSFLKEDGSYTLTSHQDKRIYNTPSRTRNQSSVSTGSTHRVTKPVSLGEGSFVRSTLDSGRSTSVQPVWKGSIGTRKRKNLNRCASVGTISRSEVIHQSNARTRECRNRRSPSGVTGSQPVCTPSSSPAGQSTTPDTTLHTAFSPLHVTLSQVRAMEESQQTLIVEERKEGTSDREAGERGKREDSGYVSREVSSVRSPSPEAAKTRLEELVNNDDTLTAEVALDSLNDSLEMDCDSTTLQSSMKDKDSASLNKRTAGSAVPKNLEATTSKNSGENTFHPVSTTSKPMSGTLLSVRSTHKRISLHSYVRNRPPGGCLEQTLLTLGVHSGTFSVSFSTALEYKFQGSRFFSSAVLRGATVCVGDGVQLALKDRMAGVREFWEGFRRSPGVDERLISFEWFSCHFRQLVWKLAALEVSYPRLFAGRCLTPDWLLLQLKYRYDREIDRAERSALRKICEHDDIPSRRMVLCVCSINHDRLSHSLADAKHGNRSMESGNETRANSSLTEARSDTPCIQLTDGWYALPCVIDPPLKHMIRSGKLTIGTKLIVFGAELVGLSSPCHPLEVPPSCSLKISANSTRRARWFAKLGYQASPFPCPIPLSSIYSDGGLVGCTDMVISRVYPLVYLEKREGAKGVFRSERQERRRATNFEKERQRKIEEICSRVEKEFEKEMAEREAGGSGRRRSRRLNTLQIKQLQDGEEIHTALSNAPDPVAFQELLNSTQRALLESYHQALMVSRQSQLQERIRQAVHEAEEESPQKRSVSPLLKVRVVPCGGREGMDCVLSVWRPDESLYTVLKEGSMVRVTHLNTLSVRSSLHRLQLTATRATTYRPLTSPDPRAFAWYTPRTCSSISYLLEQGNSCHLPHGELDTVGVVACISSDHVMSHDLEEGSRCQLDTVFLADSEEHLLQIKIWNGLEARCLQDVSVPGALLAVTNLTYKGIDRTHNLPTATAGDLTVFSQRPTDRYLSIAINQLRTELPSDLGEYLDSLQLPLDC